MDVPTVTPPAPPILVAPPPDAPQPVQEIPGAGPVATIITPDVGPPSGPFNIFSAENFTWWKPVLLATGIALFGGAILSIFRSRS